MLGKKQKEINQLQAELKRIRGSSAYHMSQDIEREVAAIVADTSIMPDRIAEAQSALYESFRQKELDRRIAELATKNAVAAVNAQKEQIEVEAQAEVARRAEAAAQEFRQNEGEAYRQQVIEKLSPLAARNAVAVAKLEIMGEEAERLGVELHVPTASKDETIALQDTDALKERAQKLRKHTKHSGVLEFSSLRSNDEITVCFVAKGEGHKPLTDGWGGYNRSREQRKLTLLLLDAEHGLFRVITDSWMSDTSRKDSVLRAGRNLLISARHPDTNDPSPIIVKGEGLHLQIVEGTEIINPLLDIWWVNLSKYRALS